MSATHRETAANPDASGDPRRPLNVSVAIPIFNEQDVLPELYRRVSNVLQSLPGEHEIVFVDDGSSDETAEILESLALIDDSVKAVILSRNFGHQIALTAALENVTGDVVVQMDGDLQDSPEMIPKFIEKHLEGYDVVFAIREKRKENFVKRACYNLFYRVIHKLSEIDLPVDAGDFSLVSRRVVNVMRSTPERHRYLRGLRTWAGFRQTGVVVERAARHSGESKYSFAKLLELAFNGIFSFSVSPLRASSMVGLLTVTGSLIYAIYSIASLFLVGSPQGFTALIVAITFLSGVQLICLGVIGEYIGRIYEEVKQRPHFVVDRILTADSLATGNTATGHAIEADADAALVD